MLLSLQLDNMPPEYLTERAKIINAVTIEDIRRVAAKIFKDPLLVVVAGQPKGIGTN